MITKSFIQYAGVAVITGIVTYVTLDFVLGWKSSYEVAIAVDEARKKCLPYEDIPVLPITVGSLMRDKQRFRTNVGNHLEEIYPDTTMKASLQCTFSLTRLKAFLGQIESSAEEFDRPKENLAVTWHYVIYEKDHAVETHLGEKNYGMKQSLYGVPSVLTSSGVQLIDISDFTAIDTSDFAKSVPYFGPDNYIGSRIGFNQGGLCPDDCSPTELRLLGFADYVIGPVGIDE